PEPPPARRARARAMIPKRWIEAYLWFLLRNRLVVTIAVAVLTVFFGWQATHLKVVPQFLDFYPGPSKISILGHEWTWRRGHPDITLYHAFPPLFVPSTLSTV